MAAASLVVCVPARNEADRLPHLLDALTRQTSNAFSVVVSLNNTDDQSLEVIAATVARHPDLQIVVDDVQFDPVHAHAGSARRRAMDLAADRAGAEGLILTTDADTRPPSNWISQNVAAIARGIDLVGGKIVIDPDEMMPEVATAASRLTDHYWEHVRAIEDAIDPIPWDPPPRHGDHTGASLCITVAAYLQCGGVPAIPSGEDRALVQAVLRQGGRLAHPLGVWTYVSPRIVGRAAGGMADYMRRLQDHRHARAGIMLPSFDQWRHRAEWRRRVRATGGGALVAELEGGQPPMSDNMVLDGTVVEPAP